MQHYQRVILEDLEKNCFILKIIDNKIKANEAKYDLDRLAAIISAKSSGKLGKLEYLTGEDLGCKPSALEKSKFECSTLGMAFNKAFKKDEVKNIAKSESDFNYDSNHAFYRFYKGFDEFKDANRF